MSLLIKALEQAAKDRDAASKADTSGQNGSTPNVTSIADTGAQRRTASSLSGLSQIEAQQRARAASIVQAGESRGGQVLSYLRGNPVAMIAAAAVGAGILFGAYVYVQIASPSLFARQPPPAPPAAAAPPAPGPSAPVADANPPAVSQPAAPPPAPTVIAALPDTPAPVAAPPAAAGTIAAPLAPEKTASAAVPTPSGPIPTGAVIGAPAAVAATAPREALAQRESREPMAEAPRDARRDVPRETRAAPATASRERIVVSSGNAKPVMNPLLGTAYTALQAGDIEQARAAYKRVNDAEPLNIDAMLGLAFIAAQENRSDDAMREYLRILQLDPRNTVAQAAMIGLVGRADPTAAESRVKQLIAREPAPFLHFILGNVYADQSAWPQAQQAYFQAQALEPDNADYAYNLAVSLDHLRQSKLALNYYRRAETLAGARGRPNFNVPQARERIRSLSAQVE